MKSFGVRTARVIALSLIAAMAAACGGGGAAPDPGGPPTTQGWTVLVYMAADNDLEPAGLQDLLEMSAIGSSANLRFVVQADRAVGEYTGGLLGQPEWTGARRFLVQQGSLQLLSNLGTVDMAASATLADFITWGVTTYPGERTMLVLWDHGGAWTGFGVDYSAGAMMGLNQIAAGVTQGLAGAGLARLDVLGFDACLMASVEVAEALKGKASYLLASEEVEPGHGWDYRAFGGGGALDPVALSKKVIDGYMVQATAENTVASVTLSLVDLSKLGPIESALAGLAAAYPSGAAVAPLLPAIAQGRNAAHAYGANPDPARAFHSLDVADLVDNLTGVTGAAALKAAALGAVIYQRTGQAQVASRGLAIYFPPGPASYKAEYDALPGMGAWRTFLASVYGSSGSAAVPGFASGSLDPTNALLTVTGDLGTTGGAAVSATIYHGVRGAGTVAFLYGEEPASISGNTVTGTWDWSFMTLGQGLYQEFGYLALRDNGDGTFAAIIPFLYDLPAGGGTLDAFRVIAFNGAGALLSDTLYAVQSGGAVGALAPVAGSKLRARVLRLADATVNDGTWVPYSNPGDGFDATQDVLLDFVTLNVGAGYFVGMDALNANGVGGWLYSVDGEVRP